MDALSELIFVDLGAKLNGQCYRDALLQKLLPAIRCVSGNMFTFQQDSDTARCARDIELLRRSAPDFTAPDMWSANSPDLNPVDYAIWSMM